MLRTSSLHWLFSRSLSSRQLFIEKRGVPEKVVQMRTIELPKKLDSEQVLVEWNVAVVNPADLNQIQGVYRHLPKLPHLLGIEGVGTVTEIGKSVKTLNVGDRVMLEFTNLSGTWAEHGLFQQKELISVDKDLAIEDAAMLKINPTSAYIMLKEYAALKPGDWVLQNCGNSALGRLVIQLSRIFGFKTISIVRNRPNIDELIKELKDMGADEVIIDEDLFDRKKKIKLPKVKLALNGVGGKSSLYLAGALGPGGRMVTYGGMSREPVQAPTAPLIFDNIELHGFWLTNWSHAQNDRRALLKMLRELTGWMKSGELKRTVFETKRLEEYEKALVDAQKFDKKQVFLMKN